MPKGKRKRYPGILGERLIEGKYGEADIEARVAALADHYGISRSDPDIAWKLVVHLTKAHVEGFQVQKKGGRPRTYDQDVITDLAYDFFRTKRQLEAQGDKAGPDVVLETVSAKPRYAGMEFTEIKALFHRRRPRDLTSFAAILEWMAAKGNVLTNEDFQLMVEAAVFILCEHIHSSK